jgi:hypothetical protein
MHSRVPKVFIGKSVAISVNQPFPAGAVYTAPTVGEIIILNKNMTRLASTYTVAVSDTIYIAEVLAETYTVGTLTVNRILLSDAIVGSQVKSYLGKSYAPKVEKVATLDFAGATITAGTEYVIRIIYKDIVEHPGQFTHTYRVTPTLSTSATLITAFKAAINNDSKSRVVATGTTTLILTAMAIPSGTSSLNDIDAFNMIDFEVVEYYVSNAAGTAGQHISLLDQSKVTYTDGSYGAGNWAAVRDAEKNDATTRGLTNKTQFPVQGPIFRTNAGSNYDCIVIEYNTQYEASNLINYKETPKIATIFVVDGAAQGVGTGSFTVILNTWMASLGKGFAAITL